MPEYVRRFFQYPQMDMDYTLWQMLYLCIAPSRVYRTTKYHKQTKNQWARDGMWLWNAFSVCMLVVAVRWLSILTV
jgi:UNC-50 family